MLCLLHYLVDGTVTLPMPTLKAQQGGNYNFSCEVTGESFVAWVTPAKPARPGRHAIPSVRIPASQNTTVNRRRISVYGDYYELAIENVTVDDGGEYICEGSIDNNSAVFTLQVDCKSTFLKASSWPFFNTRGRIIRPEGKCVLSVFILKTYYPSGRTWANICSSSGYLVFSIKTGTRRIVRQDELSFEIRLE